MKVTPETVRYVADLAHLELTAEEQERMVRDLNSILEHIDRLNQLDTTGVPPMAQPSLGYSGDDAAPTSATYEYAMREDSEHKSLEREPVMAKAPESDGTYFKVPKVIER